MLTTLILALASATLPQTPPPADDAEARVAAAARLALAPVAERMEDVAYLRARFVQRQESLLLDEPIVTEGALLLRTDAPTLVLEIDGEHPTRIRSDRTTHTIHHLEERRAERWVFERNVVADAMLACLGADAEALEKTFRATAVEALRADEDEGLPARTLVALEPRDERVARIVERLELVVDVKAKAILEVRHRNPDGERTTLTLARVELDPKDWKDPEAAFSADLPEGTELRTRRVPKPK